MYNRRVPKSHPRVEAYGAVDELNSALGMARATARHDFIKANVEVVQEHLVILMGELATSVADLKRYVADGFSLVKADMTARLEGVAKDIEAQKISMKGWAKPGATLNSAALDMARATCRRAERGVVGLQERAELENPEIIIYLNRLSDLLWLMARWVESQKDEGSAA
jgi:cob(I)alamin adenosyltransferase